MRKVLIGTAGLVSFLALGGVAALGWFRYNYAPDSVVEYARIGDISLNLYVFEPAENAAGRLRPAALLFHGGGWRSGHPALMFHTAQLLAAEGYVAMSASYRLKNGDGATPFDCVDDAKHAYRWLWDHADRLGIDRRRIVVGGSSAGGHLAAAVSLIARPTDPVDRPAAMLLFNPAVDTSFEEPTTAAIQYIEDEFQGRGREISPTDHIRAGDPPAIVFHGIDDGMVPIEHARRFCDRMHAVGNTCELVTYPNTGHGFYNLGLSLVPDVNRKLLAFLDDQHIQPEPDR